MAMVIKNQLVVLVSSVLLLVAAGVPADELFVERAGKLGIDFEHFNGMTGDLFFPEMMGAGAALLDYDNDGDLDVYLVQGAPFVGASQKPLLGKPKHIVQGYSDRLYRNDLIDGTANFVDVTASANLPSSDYGMGVATGDVNGDGWVDLYVTNFGENRLLINNGQGAFDDRTEAAGVGDARWSVSASFSDYDRDGDLDLYVVNYVDFSFDNVKTCRSHYDAPDYCSPSAYQGVGDRLFRNKGNGTFENVSASSGIAKASGSGLGVVAADFNADGWPDWYVANDGEENHLWLNNQSGRFVDEAMLAGVAVNMAGSPEASMGVAAADSDGDGDMDLFMTHLDRESNTLYRNDGKGWFTDVTTRSALGSSSLPYTGFGTLWFDYDNDGWLDLFSANGAVVRIEEQYRSGDPFPLRQANQLWRGTGAGAYADVSVSAGKAFEALEVSRGAAFGDIDNDGDPDILVTNNAGPARLMLNQVGSKQHWLGLRVKDSGGRDDWPGTLIKLTSSDHTIVRRVATDGSYGSAHDPRVILGLGKSKAPAKIEIVWPDGSRQITEPLELDRYHVINKKQP